MWMQVLAAAGFEPLGAAFPGRWKESIGDANPEGFFESRFRDGVYHATNPLPGGIYVHPDRVRDRAVKVFPFGVRRSHRAFLDRVVVTMRPCAEYVRSRARLYAMESAHRDQELGERVTPVRYVPAYLEWFFENLTLLGDLRLRRLSCGVIFCFLQSFCFLLPVLLQSCLLIAPKGFTMAAALHVRTRRRVRRWSARQTRSACARPAWR